MGKLASITDILQLLNDHFAEHLVSVIKHQSRLLLDKNQTESLLIITTDSNKFLNFIELINNNKSLRQYFLICPPLLLSEAEIQHSCDVFPVEFNEICEAAETLYGKPLNKIINIQNINLRLQVESNLRRNIILLRREFFVRGQNLLPLLYESLTGFVLNLKYMLRLKNVQITGHDKKQIISKAAGLFPIDVQPFFLVVRKFEEKKPYKIKNKELLTLFDSYLKQLMIITNEVDTMIVS
ncbi:MAG: hypothetical protein PHV30_00095 [Candidatus Margulisbacteria bacterium]|nr:hypothetical protein [Candidatus Margulisiibacteriota bacterium]